MKNRKGFTLTEIVATLVIIGVLLLIAIPTYSHFSKKFEKEYYEKKFSTIEKAATTYFQDNKIELPSDLLNSYSTDINALVDNKYIDKEAIKIYKKDNTCEGWIVSIKKEDGYKNQLCMGCGNYKSYDNDEKSCDKAWVTDEENKSTYNNINDSFIKPEVDTSDIYIYYDSDKNAIDKEINKNKLKYSYDLYKCDSNDDNCTKLDQVTQTINEYPINYQNLDMTKTSSNQEIKYKRDNSKRMVIVYRHSKPSITNNIIGSDIYLKDNKVNLIINDYNLSSFTHDDEDESNDSLLLKYQYSVDDNKTWIDIDSCKYDSGKVVKTKDGKNNTECSFDASSLSVISLRVVGIKDGIEEFGEPSQKYTIKKGVSIDKPSNSYCNVLTYNGEPQTLVKPAGTGFSWNGTTIRTDAGSYVIYAKLNTGYIWSDETTSDKAITCKINQKPITIKARDESYTYDGTTHSVTNNCDIESGSESLVNGHSVTCLCSGSRKETGVGTKSLDNVTIKNGSNVDVTKNYNITRKNGTIEITNPKYYLYLNAGNYISRIHYKKSSDSTWSSITNEISIENIPYGTTYYVYAEVSNSNYTYSYNSQSNYFTIYIDSNKSYTIQGTPKVYKITLNDKGGSGGIGSIYEKYGVGIYKERECINVINNLSTLNVPTKSGYTFGGYYDGSYPYITYFGSLHSNFGNTAFTSDVTLYAKWDKIASSTYTVTYNANGGNGAPSNQTKTHGEDLTLSSTKPTRNEYNFLGWSTSSTATRPSYNAGGTYSNNENVTLYAVWEKVQLEDINAELIATDSSYSLIPSGTTKLKNNQTVYYSVMVRKNESSRINSITLNGNGISSSCSIDNNSSFFNINYSKYSSSSYDRWYCTLQQSFNTVGTKNFTATIKYDSSKYTYSDYNITSYEDTSTAILYSTDFNCNNLNGKTIAPNTYIYTNIFISDSSNVSKVYMSKGDKSHYVEITKLGIAGDSYNSYKNYDRYFDNTQTFLINSDTTIYGKVVYKDGSVKETNSVTINVMSCNSVDVYGDSDLSIYATKTNGWYNDIIYLKTKYPSGAKTNKFDWWTNTTEQSYKNYSIGVNGVTAKECNNGSYLIKWSPTKPSGVSLSGVEGLGIRIGKYVYYDEFDRTLTCQYSYNIDKTPYVYLEYNNSATLKKIEYTTDWDNWKKLSSGSIIPKKNENLWWSVYWTSSGDKASDTDTLKCFNTACYEQFYGCGGKAGSSTNLIYSGGGTSPVWSNLRITKQVNETRNYFNYYFRACSSVTGVCSKNTVVADEFYNGNETKNSICFGINPY